MLRTGL